MICKRGGTISHSAMRVLESSSSSCCAGLAESLRLSYEAIAEAALLSPRTVGRAVRRLAGLGLITIH
jgi:DNA-binding transcriptional ArsR family regulator